MASGSLSSSQFSGPSPSVQVAQPQRPSNPDISTPLSLSSGTEGSAKQAAAWRKPDRVLPYSKATSGSVFKPFD